VTETEDLASAPVPPVGPEDHVRGEGPEAILYVDLACPHCAASWARIRPLPLRLCVRHFPLSARRPRSPALHAAAEAAGLEAGEDAFWGMWDSLLADRAHHDDPHLWHRAEALGIEPVAFDRRRRSGEVAERVQRDFRSGVRAGVGGTPAGFVGCRLLRGDVVEELERVLAPRGL
jgi:protein-disulfide isomerase